jgi:MoaA/NifB/PqqE/SkfB family radical SAM enzyme
VGRAVNLVDTGEAEGGDCVSLGGLSKIFVEWTSFCDKTHLCGMCGHQANEKLQIGEMSLDLMRSIRDQLPHGVETAFHKDGDPLAFSKVGVALQIFHGFIRVIVTHGLNLSVKANEIIGAAETVVVSIFRGDRDSDEQLESLRQFAKQKGPRAPRLIVKVVGDMSDAELSPYWEVADDVIHRLIHIPLGNSKYAHRAPTKPESAICQDLLHVPSISWNGDVSICNRLDVEKKGLIGNLNEESLDTIWNGKLRADYIQKHIEGRRADVPACKDCLYYGVPSA